MRPRNLPPAPMVSLDSFRWCWAGRSNRRFTSERHLRAAQGASDLLVVAAVIGLIKFLVQYKLGSFVCPAASGSSASSSESGIEGFRRRKQQGLAERLRSALRLFCNLIYEIAAHTNTLEWERAIGREWPSPARREDPLEIGWDQMS